MAPLLVVAGTFVVIAGVHVADAHDWAGTAAECAALAEAHLEAQADVLRANAQSGTDLANAREATFAALGQTCGWETAQDVDMRAYMTELSID